MADAKQVQDYKDTVKVQAEELVLKGFPETIVKLNTLLDTPQFKNRLFTEVHQDLSIPYPDPIVLNKNSDLPPAKKTKYDHSLSSNDSSKESSKMMVLPSGSVPTNKNLVELVETVKPQIRKLMEDSNLMKMWISFMIPKIEDGNNFGVSIQEDTLAEVQSVEAEAAAFFDQISRYFISRGKLISKVAKYPHIDDYRRAVQELDEKEYLSLWLMLSEIRNRYCALHDIVLKNIDKIKKPRSSNATESLY
ncbi:proteasome activator complex subunit 3 isoform X2 [Anthonomus grandis grandis]|uniref:proteasome activator complex subunit 3 isoform X2 n=1 Tax=Anthonomus grandis grandis TaxID=2921223 RepID=UPI0021662861|nr:proteasome activator complex subunit 3 isoform X2 [Anthonomus grandis grandis]